ncbi:MAG: hypothetical protein HFJ51_02335 [Clostridia bacterium]|nr:hypothetical protein [Clostridia bacterium]
MEDIKIKEYIFQELSDLKFVKCSKGYTYLNEAILMCIKDISIANNLSKNVYTVIAKKYKETSPRNVKGCMEQAINTMFNNTKPEILYKHFYTEKYEKPTLKLIIWVIVNKYELYQAKRAKKTCKNN